MGQNWFEIFEKWTHIYVPIWGCPVPKMFMPLFRYGSYYAYLRSSVPLGGYHWSLVLNLGRSTKYPCSFFLFKTPSENEGWMRAKKWECWPGQSCYSQGLNLPFGNSDKVVMWTLLYPAPHPHPAPEGNKLNLTLRPALEKGKSNTQSKELLREMVYIVPTATMDQFSSLSWVLIIEYSLTLRKSSIILPSINSFVYKMILLAKVFRQIYSLNIDQHWQINLIL